MINLPTNLQPPKNCIHCGTQLIIHESNPFCPNYHCWMRVYGRIQKFVKVLDIKGSGIETLKGLVKAGIIKSPADLWDITEQQFCQLERKGEKHYAKFRQGLEAKKDMSPAQFFASLDIEGLGTWENICSVKGLSTISEILSQADAGNIPLFDSALYVSSDTARSIFSQIRQKRGDIEKLRQKVQLKTAGTKLIGKVFCITGSLSRSRSQIETWIKDNGGGVSSDVTSRTTHLVCNDKDSKSSKMKKAQKKGIPILAGS